MHNNKPTVRIFLLLTFYLLSSAECTDYFASKIYNNNSSSKTKSTFTLLETAAGFNLEEAEKKRDVKNIFIIINGQQNPCGQNCTGEESDELFGRALTGIHRVGKASYKVYRPHIHNSVAGTLYDRYSENSIVIDILNPKYNWEHSDNFKQQTERYIRDIVYTLLDNKPVKVNLFITGFSRGGLLAYKLAQDLKSRANVRALVTVDPVINPFSTDTQNIASTAHYKLRAKEWELTHRKLPAFLKPLHNFPVLKNPKVPTYNVFQRNGLFSHGGGQFGKPIGSAIEGAMSACKTYNICALFNGDTSKHGPFDQYDSAVAYHSPEMLQKYNNWILNIALNTMPLPEAKKPALVVKPVKPIIKKIMGQTSLYCADKVHFNWIANQGGLEYQYSMTLAGKEAEWSDWNEDRYSYTYTLYDEGNYIFRVRARNKNLDISPVKSTLLNIKPRPPHLRYLRASDRVATPGMTISFEWDASDDDLDYKIKFIRVGKEVIADKLLHGKDKYSIILYEQGDYVFKLQAFTKKGVPSRVYTRAVTITDYIYPDEVLIGAPPFNTPSNPLDPKSFSGTYAIGKLVHRPEETKDSYWEGTFSIGTPDWEKDKLFRSPWGIEKSMPARKENLSMGQTILYSGWNPSNPSDVRGSVMNLAVIDDLSQVDKGIVGASWPNADDPSRLDKKKLYLHNIRVCIKPENCLSLSKEPKWQELILKDKKGNFFSNTSELKSFKVEKLFNNKIDTCLAEGGHGISKGEVVNFSIEENTMNLQILNGYQKSEKLFDAHNRVKKIKYQLLLGINIEGEVTEIGSLFHTMVLNTEKDLLLQDQMNMQSLDLQLDWNKIKAKAQALVQEYSLKHSKKLHKEYILRFTLIDIYPGSKYNDTCISEIKRVLADLSVTNIYLNNNENSLFIDTNQKKNILLDSDDSKIFQIVNISKDKQWVIVIVMPSDVSNSRTETTYLLYNTYKKLKYTSAQLGVNVGELYDFEYNNGQQILHYLNTSNMKISSLNLDKLLNK